MSNPAFLYAQLNLLGIICNLKNIEVQHKDGINVFLVLVVFKIVRKTKCSYLCHVIYASNSIKD